MILAIGMPMWKSEKLEDGTTKIIELFQRHTRSVYRLEGFMMSILATVIAMTYLLLILASKWFRQKYAQRACIYIMVLVLFALHELYLHGYRFKYPWYSPQFLPPDYYQRGSLMKDQGNNI